MLQLYTGIYIDQQKKKMNVTTILYFEFTLLVLGAWVTSHVTLQ